MGGLYSYIVCLMPNKVLLCCCVVLCYVLRRIGIQLNQGGIIMKKKNDPPLQQIITMHRLKLYNYYTADLRLVLFRQKSDYLMTRLKPRKKCDGIASLGRICWCNVLAAAGVLAICKSETL